MSAANQHHDRNSNTLQDNTSNSDPNQPSQAAASETPNIQHLPFNHNESSHTNDEWAPPGSSWSMRRDSEEASLPDMDVHACETGFGFDEEQEAP